MLKPSRANVLAQFPDTCIQPEHLRCDRRGFAVLSVSNGRIRTSIKAHRLVYRLFVAGIEEGAAVRHSCGNPACINPRHLFAGDPAAVPPAPTFGEEVCHG